MNKIILSPFIADLTCTGALFALCFLVVVGAKYLIVVIKQYLPQNREFIPEENKKPSRSHKKRRAKVNSNRIKNERTIEIDPEKIDRIYVKKSS